MELREAVPLMVLRNSRQIWGKTRLQKLVFLLQVEQLERTDDPLVPFQYELYKYGPFSLDLILTVEGLSNQNFLEEELHRTSEGNPVYRYLITDKGMKEIDRSLAQHGEWSDWDSLAKDIVSRYRDLELPLLVEEAYGAAQRHPDMITESEDSEELSAKPSG